MNAGIILTHGGRRTNAAAIADAAALGYLPGPILDLTYGLGRFWGDYRPDDLTTNDLDPQRGADYQIDWTDIDAVDAFIAEHGQFATVVFDPPYKLNGSGGSHASDDGYGVADSATAHERNDAMTRGLHSAMRLTATGGYLLHKCQDQVVSAKKVWQTYAAWATVTAVPGWRLVDQLLVAGHRPQPPGRRQVHARQDYSTLMIFRRGVGDHHAS